MRFAEKVTVPGGAETGSVTVNEVYSVISMTSAAMLLMVLSRLPTFLFMAMSSGMRSVVDVEPETNADST